MLNLTFGYLPKVASIMCGLLKPLDSAPLCFFCPTSLPPGRQVLRKELRSVQTTLLCHIATHGVVKWTLELSVSPVCLCFSQDRACRILEPWYPSNTVQKWLTFILKLKQWFQIEHQPKFWIVTLLLFNPNQHFSIENVYRNYNFSI